MVRARGTLILYSLGLILVGIATGWFVDSGEPARNGITNTSESNLAVATNLSRYVKVESLKVQRILNVSEVREIVVSGEVQNLSDRTIVRLGLTVQLLGDDGKLLWEHRYYPVRAEEGALSDGSEKPLLPNQVRGEFWHSMREDLPPWEGEYRYWISHLEFESLEADGGG